MNVFPHHLQFALRVYIPHLVCLVSAMTWKVAKAARYVLCNTIPASLELESVTQPRHIVAFCSGRNQVMSSSSSSPTSTFYKKISASGPWKCTYTSIGHILTCARTLCTAQYFICRAPCAGISHRVPGRAKQNAGFFLSFWGVGDFRKGKEEAAGGKFVANSFPPSRIVTNPRVALGCRPSAGILGREGGK